MKLSDFPVSTQKTIPNLSENRSTGFLLQWWYIRQEVAWVFNYLPLWLKILNNIKSIITKHLESLGAYEILMSSIGSKEHWEQTGRQGMDILFKLPSSWDKHNFLNPTHEEIVVPLMKEFFLSYTKLPAKIFQTQTKFRNEARAKSWLLRWREFIMNDMYSFHKDKEDLESFYEQVIQTYHNIFKELWIGDDTYLTYASGGDFTDFSHEFQTILPIWEDVIYVDKEKKIAINKEIYWNPKIMEKFDWYKFEPENASEIGNIFKLGVKFSKPFAMDYVNEEWKKRTIEMGCYGIGVSRSMGIIAEKMADWKWLIRPKNITPFDYHIIQIRDTQQTSDILKILDSKNKTFILDDTDRSFWAKMNDADLLWIPKQVISSDKNKEKNQIEIKDRQTGVSEILSIDEFKNMLNSV